MAHSCNACGKSFQKDYHLHGHRIESRFESCWRCMYCSYKFSNKTSEQIRNHMLSQHGVQCGMCGKTFISNDSLEDHVYFVHENPRRGFASSYNRIPNVNHERKSRAQSSKGILNKRLLSDLESCGNSLKRLLDEKVRQDPDKMRRCNEIVHHLVTFMQHNLECGVSEVVKGGSLGKGTSIKEKVDIDLVVFMKRFTSVADLQEQHEEVIKDLKKHILHDFTFAKKVHYNYDTKHSNRFHLRTDDEDLIQVDLLPACDIGGGSRSVFREMAGLDEDSRSFYSVSFAKDQVRFTKEKPELVKDVIRLIKHWKTVEKLNIVSYTVEIITIKEWERMGSPTEVDLDQLFERTMTELCHIGSINITWSNPRKGFEQPIVMDPENPFQNTASRIGHSDQTDIARKAQEIVNRLRRM